MFEIYKKNSYVVFNLSEVIMTIIINYDLIIFQDNEYSNQGIKNTTLLWVSLYRNKLNKTFEN